MPELPCVYAVQSFSWRSPATLMPSLVTYLSFFLHKTVTSTSINRFSPRISFQRGEAWQTKEFSSVLHSGCRVRSRMC